MHYAPHGHLDVKRLGCDFLVCSPYKFFGPHAGVLYGRRELLASLSAERLDARNLKRRGRVQKKKKEKLKYDKR